MNCAICTYELDSWNELICKLCNRMKCLDLGCDNPTDGLYCQKHIEMEINMNKKIKDAYKLLKNNDIDIYF